MEKTQLSVDAAQLAWKWAAKIAGTGLESRPNYVGETGESAQYRYFTGFLGEIALKKSLVNHGIRHEYRVRLDGRSDSSEFAVFLKGQRVSIDVKTAGKPFHRMFAIPEKQILDSDIYVGARVLSITPECWIELHGWLGHDEVLTLPIVDFGRDVPARGCNLGCMKKYFDEFPKFDP